MGIVEGGVQRNGDYVPASSLGSGGEVWVAVPFLDNLLAWALWRSELGIRALGKAIRLNRIVYIDLFNANEIRYQ